MSARSFLCNINLHMGRISHRLLSVITARALTKYLLYKVFLIYISQNWPFASSQRWELHEHPPDFSHCNHTCNVEPTAREWSSKCGCLCWAKGNQGEIYEHNNESYACFNYNNPGPFEVCCCSWQWFALCLSPLQWTDKYGSSVTFACWWKFLLFVVIFG